MRERARPTRTRTRTLWPLTGLLLKAMGAGPRRRDYLRGGEQARRHRATQFGYLTPGELLKPFGQLNRFSVLWDFMAVSTGYTIFAGLAEFLGSVLLFFRRTALVGALLLLTTTTNVLAIDIGYRVYGRL